jgi:hypothetical protein
VQTTTKCPAAQPDDAPPTDPELARLVELWPTLAEAVRQAIAHLIDEAKSRTGS